MHGAKGHCSAGAALFGNIVAFGDSLTHNGNLYAATEATGGIPPAPSYSNGRFSNGPVWVEYLATFVSNKSIAPACQRSTGSLRVATVINTQLLTRAYGCPVRVDKSPVGPWPRVSLIPGSHG